MITVNFCKIGEALYAGSYLKRTSCIFGFNDSVEAEPYREVSKLICWHCDHSNNRAVKGDNFLTALYQSGNMRLPCAVEFVRKYKLTTEGKPEKQKRTATKTK